MFACNFFLSLIIASSISIQNVDLSTLEEPSVQTRYGPIQGYYKTSYLGNKYRAFEGVPYAQPPMGERRFEPPVPIKPWPGALTAKRLQSVCLQHKRTKSPNNDYVEGSEDCLYLNIYVPLQNLGSKYPILFLIHGGAFQYGKGWHRERYLIDREFIIVTINYRLNALGFLSTEDDVVPGNMGLKDQNLALRWIHENIDSFGGDPGKITIFGFSAGGASVHYHLLSPMSRGLFRNGVSLSGTALAPWALMKDARNKTIKLGSLVGCPTRNSREVVECLKSRPAHSLVAEMAQFMPWKLNPFTPFGPLIETISNGAFIDQTPIKLTNSGKVADVPWLVGVSSEEGLYNIVDIAHDEVALKDLDENWNEIAPLLLNYNYTIAEAEQKNISVKIRKNYFGDKRVNNETLTDLVHVGGDRLFIVDAIKAATLQAKVNKSPVWFYYYNYKATKKHKNGIDLGVAHGDDFCLMFDNEHIPEPVTQQDKNMQKILLDLIASFMNKGSPESLPEWPRVGSDGKFRYLHIQNPEGLIVKNDSNLARYEFWDSISFNENKV